jgi:hypothetical protein
MSQASSNLATIEANTKPLPAPPALPAYTEKHEWRLAGPGFVVTVSKHEVEEFFDEGGNRWCVYAYIYPSHPYFKEFKGPSLWQPATEAMPLHHGCSYLKYHLSDAGSGSSTGTGGNSNNIASVQVGCDYNHLHDEHFTHAATKEAAHQVFHDAEFLFKWLAARSAT